MSFVPKSWIRSLLLAGATACLLNNTHLIGQDSEGAVAVDEANKSMTAEKAAFLALRMPQFRWRVSLDGIEFLRNETIGITLPDQVSDSEGIVCAISAQLVDGELPEPLREWEEKIRGIVLAPKTNARSSQVLTMGTSELVSSFQTNSREAWRIVGVKEGVVFVSVPSVAPENYSNYRSGFAGAMGAPKYFMGKDKEAKLGKFDSAELLLKECFGGVAMDEKGNRALVTKYQNEVKIYDRNALGVLYSSVTREIRSNLENEQNAIRITALQNERDNWRSELQQLEGSLATSFEDEKIAAAEAALSREKAMIRFDAIKSQLQSAKAELQHEEEILSAMEQRVSSAKRAHNSGTMSGEEVYKIELEYKMQKKEVQVAMSKIQQLETEKQTADIQIQVFHLESARLELNQQRKSKPIQDRIVQTRLKLAEVEKELNNLAGKASGAGSPQQENATNPLSGKSRDEVYRVLEEQFRLERESNAKELRGLRERIEKLERSEQDKQANKESILQKRLDSILGPKS